jgi:hypothetical protein
VRDLVGNEGVLTIREAADEVGIYYGPCESIFNRGFGNEACPGHVKVPLLLTQAGTDRDRLV